jgi:excisionase family DNA binding protein
MAVSACQNGRVASRFLTLADVQELLSISQVQAYSLVRSGDLPAIQVGGRNQWRVEASELEAYIQRQYAATREKISQPDADLTSS